MQSSTAKACLIPVCKNRKFNLVHKLPSDKERFSEWMDAIQAFGAISKLNGLQDSPDAIRKRFFICSRHFGLSQYKNIESRSLNLTAVPHLNIKDLDEIHLSKAWHLENNSEIIAELQQEKAADKSSPSKLTPAVRILNPGASSKKSNETKKIFQVVKRHVATPQVKMEPEANERPAEALPPVKRIKRTDEYFTFPIDMQIENPTEPVVSPKLSMKVKPETTTVQDKTPLPQKSETVQKPEATKVSTQEPETYPVPSGEVKSSNKLLALFEVTLDQFEKLSKSLSAERSENISSIINFLDNENENERTDNS